MPRFVTPVRHQLFSLIAWPLAIVGAGILWRSSPAELLVAGPGFVLPRTALQIAVGLGVGITLTTLRYHHRPHLKLLAHLSAVFGTIWFLAPANEIWDLRPLAAGGVILTISSVILIRRRAWLVAPQARTPHVFDAVMVLLPVVVGLVSRAPLNGHSLTVSLFTYPIYAFCQLTVLVAVPVVFMRDMGLTKAQIAAFSAAFFGLSHWPNPVLVIATFTAMLVWTRAFLNGRHLVHLALVMGLAATSLSQFIPDSWTEHMKVGPGLVRRRVLTNLAGPVIVDPRDPMAQHDREPDDFLAEIYPVVIGRELTNAERVLWLECLRRNLCAAMIFRFAQEPEFARLVAAGRTKLPLPVANHWTEAPLIWRQRLRELSGREYWEAHGSSLDSFYRAAFAEMYQRPYPSYGTPAFTARLTTVQKRRLVEVLHRHRGQWHQHPFSGLADNDLRWTTS